MLAKEPAYGYQLRARLREALGPGPSGRISMSELGGTPVLRACGLLAGLTGLEG
jgi:hypothetical protein